MTVQTSLHISTATSGLIMTVGLPPGSRAGMQHGAQEMAGLLQLFMYKLKDRSRCSNPEVIHNAAVLELLLRNRSQDLAERTQAQVLSFFRDVLRSLKAEDGLLQLTGLLISGLNVFLLAYGLDVTSRMSEFHMRVWPFVSASLKSTRHHHVKEGLFMYLRLQLQLGEVSQDPTVLLELWKVVKNELTSHVMANQKHLMIELEHGKRIVVNHEQHSLIQLAAAVFFLVHRHILQAGDSGDPGHQSVPDGTPPASKRLHAPDHAQEFIDNTLDHPCQWAPVMCMAIRRFQSGLPKEILQEWLQKLHQGLARVLKATKPKEIVWFLRCVHELADVAFTACQHWQGIWDSICDSLSVCCALSAQITTIGEEALRLLARMVEKGLVHAPGLVPEFWHQQVFDMSKPPSRGMLELVCHVLGRSSGASSHAVAQELMLRQQLLDWVGTCLEFPRGLAGAEAAQTLPSTTLQSPGRPHHSAGTGAADGIPRLVQNALLAIALGVAPGGRADASGDSEPAALSWWIETEEACLAEGVLDIIQRPYRALYPEPQTDTVRFPPLCKPLLDNPTVYNYPESFGTKISTSPTEITS
ncbi:hypothetical protein CYMTET_19119 [Cymbomonas tetramitiformis]|uniref:Uncharacterized protein n=1 Tax=Cymbomonas tetramitiformis TaxID=36881 RepID=A0AAE0L573_9CHLO|nr:hypothetical protein CYMTET_19119 [Cymbomonas tetramitiformis]